MALLTHCLGFLAPRTMREQISLVLGHAVCSKLLWHPYETNMSREPRPKVWTNQPSFGFNCISKKENKVGGRSDPKQENLIHFNSSHFNWVYDWLFKAMQVPTGKPALPEKQVGSSHGTCWQ